MSSSQHINWDDFHKEQILETQHRLIKHILNKNTTDHAPTPFITNASTYTSENQFQAEKEEIFLKQPVLACLSSDMPNPGDVVLFNEAGPPIVITRDENGKIHAFLNMCMHRGASVASSCSRRKLLVCRFHGWSYDLKGNLVGIPGKEGFDGVDQDSKSLVRLPAKEWNGMIFVRATPGNDHMDIEGFLGDFAPQLAMLRLDDVVPVHESTLETEANWKLMLDTHGEGYHFASLHPKTIAPNVISNVSVYDCLGPHYKVSFAQKTHAALAQKGEYDGDMTNYSSSMLLFPNTIVFISTHNLGKDPDEPSVSKLDTSTFYYGIYRLFPTSVSHTVTKMATYKPKNHNPQLETAAWKGVHEFIEKVLIEEDYHMAAEQYRNLIGAPTDHKVIYGSNEIGIQHFHRHLSQLTKN